MYINGTRVHLDPCVPGSPLSTLHSPPWLTDFQDLHAPIGHLLKRGTNHFQVISPTRLSEPLRLVGHFHVRLKGKEVALIEPATPNLLNLELDYPFYSGTVTYRAEFELKESCSSLVLNLHDVHDAAEVWVNGKPVGKRLWAPYTFDITGHAVTGRNEIAIEVRNNMTNLILGNPRPFGLRTAPSLSAFGSTSIH